MREGEERRSNIERNSSPGGRPDAKADRSPLLAGIPSPDSMTRSTTADMFTWLEPTSKAATERPGQVVRQGGAGLRLDSSRAAQVGFKELAMQEWGGGGGGAPESVVLEELCAKTGTLTGT